MKEPTAKEWEAIYRKRMADHEAKIAALAEKFIGKQVLARRDKQRDLWSKKQWYVHRIKHLMHSAGACHHALQRCKYDSPTYKKYDQTATELELLVDELTLELLTL